MRKFDFHAVLCHIYAGITFLVTFGVYLKTVSPTVSFFDSGELISAAYGLGVAHPPGYPLYVVLGWLFAHLPVGASVAYRLNLMSAFFAALAVLMVYYITYTLLTWNRQPRILPSGDQSPDTKLKDAEASSAKSQSVSAGFSAQTGHLWPGGADGKTEPERIIHPILAMMAALFFAFSVTHWNHAIIAEVYALNAFLCGLIVLLLLQWRERQDSSIVDLTGFKNLSGLYAVAFLFGLGFGNHQTIAVFAPAAALLVLLTRPRLILRPKFIGGILGCLLLGLAIYLLTPVFASRRPTINWGNPVTWRGFKWLITREGYSDVPKGHGVQMLWAELMGSPTPVPSQEGNLLTPTASQEGMSTSISAQEGKDLASAPAQHETPRQGWDRVVFVVRNSLFFNQITTFNPLREFAAFGVILSVIGFGFGLARHRVPTLMMLLAITTLVGVMVFISDPPPENVFLLQEFYTPAYLLLAVWTGLGVLLLVRAVLWVAGHSAALQYGAVFVLSGGCLVLPGLQMWKHFQQVDRHDNFIAYDYGTNILDSLQPNALLFTWGDSGAFPLWYLQFVEGRRPDVTLIHVPHLSTAWYVDLLPQDLFFTTNAYQRAQGDLFVLIEEIVQKQINSRPIYFDYSSSHSLELPYQMIPHGLIYKVAVAGDVLDEQVWQRYRFRGIVTFLLPNTFADLLRQNQMPESMITALQPLQHREFETEAEFVEALAAVLQPGELQQYKDLFLNIATFHPPIAIDPDIHRAFLMYGSARMELGNFYLEMGDVTKAAEHFNAAVRFEESLGEGIAELLQFRDKMYGGHVPPTHPPAVTPPITSQTR